MHADIAASFAVLTMAGAPVLWAFAMLIRSMR